MNPSLKDAISKAIEDPSKYVIKPQKEGGGNNFFGEHVREMLLSRNQEHLKQFLLMERIFPPDVKAYMLR
jgi:glutathione synthase